MRAAILFSVLAATGATASATLLPRQISSVPAQCNARCSYLMGVYTKCAGMSLEQSVLCMADICVPANWSKIVDCVKCVAGVAGVPESAYMDLFEPSCFGASASDIDLPTPSARSSGAAAPTGSPSGGVLPPSSASASASAPSSPAAGVKVAGGAMGLSASWGVLVAGLGVAAAF